MDKPFVRRALEEYATRRMPSRPDLWPAIRRQVQSAAPAEHGSGHTLERIALPTVILLGLVGLALVLGPGRTWLQLPNDAPDLPLWSLGAGNDPTHTPTPPPVNVPRPPTALAVPSLTPDTEALLNNAFSRDPTFSRINLEAMQQVNLSETIDGYTVNVRRLYANANRVIIGVIVSSPPATNVELLGGGLTTTTGIRLPFSLGVYTDPGQVRAYAYAYDNRVSDTMPAVITSHLDLNLVDMAPVRLSMAQITPVNPNGDPVSPQSSRLINPQIVAGPFAFDLKVPVVAADSRVVPYNQTVTASGLTMTLEKIVVAGNEARVFLRFQSTRGYQVHMIPSATLSVAGWRAETNGHLSPTSDWNQLGDDYGTYTFRDFPPDGQGVATLTITDLTLTELIKDNTTLTPTVRTILPGPWTFQFNLPLKSAPP